MKTGLSVHGLILALLTLTGAAVWLMEWMAADTSGGLFVRYAATRIVWLGLGAYALFSTLLVLSVWCFTVWRRRPLRPAAVVLCHIIPVALGALMIHLGVHDALQSIGSKRTRSSAPPVRHRPHIRGPMSPAIAPRLPHQDDRIRPAPLRPVAPDTQTPAPSDTDNQ
jgi:hypothetical protein